MQADNGMTLTTVIARPASQKKAGDIDASLGRRIRERREALGLSAEELSSIIGIARQQVQKYETGENRISAGRLLQIAIALGVEIAWFFDPLVTHASQSNGHGRKAALREGLLAAFDVIDDVDAMDSLVQIARSLARRRPPIS